MGIDNEIQKRLLEAEKNGRLNMISIATKISADDLQKMMKGEIPIQKDALAGLFGL